MKTQIFFFLFLIAFGKSDLCQCPILTDKFVSTIKENSDLIAIGQPIEKIILDDEARYTDEIIVRFRIDSLIKGKKSLKTILITQSSAGNCAIGFNPDEKYLITGEKVTSALETYSMTQTKHDKKLDSLIEKNYMLTTHGCRSFLLNSNSAKVFLK